MQSVEKAGKWNLGGDLPVYRMGFGSMRLTTGPGIWGPPADEENARGVLNHALELGLNLIDTADVYGPGDSERIIREALSPYRSDLVIATKGGMVRKGPATPENPGIAMDGTDLHIRRAVEASLARLGLERIDLYQLHRIDPVIPVERTMEILAKLQQEGKIRHIGLSEVGIEDIERARTVARIVSVQNIYNLAVRMHEDVLTYCERNEIAFIPFWPLHAGAVTRADAVGEIALRLNATPAQVALAWLLKKSPCILLIPGTTSTAHLSQNVAACDLELSDTDMKRLNELKLPVTA